MKVSLTGYGITVSAATDHDDLTIGEVGTLLRTALLGSGYDEALVDRLFAGEIECPYDLSAEGRQRAADRRRWDDAHTPIDPSVDPWDDTAV